MLFSIKHEIEGRLRISLNFESLSFQEADIIQCHFLTIEGVNHVKVYERTGNFVIIYKCQRSLIMEAIESFEFDDAEVPAHLLETSARELNHIYKEKLINKVLLRYLMKTFVPKPLGMAYILWNGSRYIIRGAKLLIKGKLEVPVLDAIAIGTSIIRRDASTAGSIMFLLGIGELLEEWTKKRSIDDLARTMALDVSKVWMVTEKRDILVDSNTIELGDLVRVHMGNVIPFDGQVIEGEAMVNESSMTGEHEPAYKAVEKTVYGGTVVEEGELIIKVSELSGDNRYDKIIKIIEETEKLKSETESKAEHLADKLVPYTLLGTILTWLITKNSMKALSILMVDFSCAIKLSMPIAVLSAIKDANRHKIIVKGGKYFEELALVDTVVFDKTGTLTKAQPVVKDVIPFGNRTKRELLKIAACLEEHFPHSVAKAVVKKAADEKIVHKEMHSKVEYVVAHGIASTIDGKRVVIGSQHFIFDDEHCQVPEDKRKEFENLPPEYSHLFLAIEGNLEAVLCIDDPVRTEVKNIIKELKKFGIKNVVMMTGDSRRTAEAVATKVGIDEFYAEVLPEEKATYIKAQREENKRVLMIGDGINDAPALSAAHVGIAISDGAEIAREIADIIIEEDNLEKILTLLKISRELMKRIDTNYYQIMGINGLLILLGVTGRIMPTQSALIHNTTTLLISAKSMSRYVPEEELTEE